MTYKTVYFTLDELVCPHVYYRFGDMCWMFLHEKQLELMDWVREKLGKPIYVNNWDQYKNSDYIKFIKEKAEHKYPLLAETIPAPPNGLLDERGLRCNLCSLNLLKVHAGIIYSSPHFRGQGDDYDIQGMVAEETRQWLIKNSINLPYNIRLENNVSWVHMDCLDTGKKVSLFNG